MPQDDKPDSLINLDKNTVALWLVAVLLGLGGGSVGSIFVDPEDRYYGREGRALEEKVSSVVTENRRLEEKLRALDSKLVVIDYRQEECIGELENNEKEHEDIKELLHRVERMEWDLKRIDSAVSNILGEKGVKETSTRDPLSWALPTLYTEAETAMIKKVLAQPLN